MQFDHVKDLNMILPHRIEVKALRSANQEEKKIRSLSTSPLRKEEMSLPQIPVKAGLSEEEHILIIPNRDQSQKKF